ncbi:MAG: hypothetical protein ACREX3_00355 [Gammaproteobacteria bacterium]
MRRLLLLVVGFLIALPAVVDAQRRCVKGKPCGRTCIAVNKTCRVETPSYTPPSTQPNQAAAAAKEPGDSLRWVASSRGQVYYKRGCSSANRLAPQNRIYFRSEAEAQRAGYRRSTSRGC